MKYDLNQDENHLNHCEYLDSCPIFHKFQSSESIVLWIKMYCQGPKCKQCARKIMMEKGEEPPMSLLPNGKLLLTLN